jgi:hypothetical protein
MDYDRSVVNIRLSLPDWVLLIFANFQLDLYWIFRNLLIFMFDPYLFKIYLKAIFPIDRCLSIIGPSQVSRRISYVHVGLVGPT